MRAFWGLVALLILAAALWMFVGRGGSAAPRAASPADPIAASPIKAPESALSTANETAAPGKPAAGSSTALPPANPAKAGGTPSDTGTPRVGASPAKQTGITQSEVESAYKRAFAQIAFAPSSQSDGRRRILGTLGQSRVPALEMVGEEGDLAQITAVGALATKDGPAAVERSTFAVVLLDLVAPEWSDRKDWLGAALKSAADSDANYKSDHALGRMNIHFASWKSLGVYRLTVETVEAAALSASAASLAERTLPNQDKPEIASAAKPTAETAKNQPSAQPSSEPATAASQGNVGGVKIETKADGTQIVDGKYSLGGIGTKDNPYRLTWDQLVSAQDDYVPRDGRKEIPGRIMMLHDKWVEITGHVAFPLMVDAPDECLSMMNQWDGCCIGIPPTPYDAVEIRLTEPVSGNARLTTYGSVRGRFKVDPHLVGGWLVGLYLMDQATLTPQTYGGFSP